MAAVSHKWHRGNIAVEGTNTTQASESRACRASADPITFLCMHKALVRLVANFGGCTSSGRPGESPEKVRQRCVNDDGVQQANKHERAAVQPKTDLNNTGKDLCENKKAFSLQ